MNMKLEEPVITMPLSQYEALKKKSYAADTEAGKIKQAVMRCCLEEPYMLRIVSWPEDDIRTCHEFYGKGSLDVRRAWASRFADEVLKWLHLTED